MPPKTHRTTCPHCQAPVESTDLAANKSFPFCSRRCKLIDLGHWFEGDYVIETPVDEEDE
jgi:hypothetical protein